MFPFPLPIPFEEEEVFTAVPTPPVARSEFQGTNTMFYCPATTYADDGVISREPKPVSFFSGPPASGRGDAAETMLTTATNGENGTLPFFHELDIHFQGESIMKQVIGDDDTLSLFPEIKMDGEDAKTSTSTHGIDDYSQVSHSGLGTLKEISTIPVQMHEAPDRNAHLVGMLYENNRPRSKALQKTLIQEHGMTARHYVQRREFEEEAFNAQVRNQVCQSQQTQPEEGRSVHFMSASTSAAGGQSFLSSLSSFLPSYPEQDVMDFSPSLLDSGELYLSPNPARKLETVGGKKIFSSQHQSRSGSVKGLTSSNLNSSNACKIFNPGKPTAEYNARESTRTGNFREELMLPSSIPSCFGQNLIPPNLREEYMKGHSLSPAFTPSVSTNCMQAMMAFTRSVSNYGSKRDDFDDLERSDRYTLEHRQNKSMSSSLRSMDMPLDHGQGLSVFYPVPGSSITGNQSISCTADEEGSALKGYRDLLLASYTNATISHSPIYIEDHRPPSSRSLEVLENDGFISSGEGSLINVTAKRSAPVSIHVLEPECTSSNGSGKLTNLHKEKRSIYKQARLPKKQPLSSVDAVRLIIKKRRGRYRSQGAIGGEPKVKSICTVSGCGPDTGPEQDGRHKKGIPFHACDDIMLEEGDSVALSTSDYLE